MLKLGNNVAFTVSMNYVHSLSYGRIASYSKFTWIALFSGDMFNKQGASINTLLLYVLEYRPY